MHLQMAVIIPVSDSELEMICPDVGAGLCGRAETFRATAASTMLPLQLVPLIRTPALNAPRHILRCNSQCVDDMYVHHPVPNTAANTHHQNRIVVMPVTKGISNQCMVAHAVVPFQAINGLNVQHPAAMKDLSDLKQKISVFFNHIKYQELI